MALDGSTLHLRPAHYDKTGMERQGVFDGMDDKIPRNPSESICYSRSRSLWLLEDLSCLTLTYDGFSC